MRRTFQERSERQRRGEAEVEGQGQEVEVQGHVEARPVELCCRGHDHGQG